ncbi:ABC-2 family transporter protein [Clostridium tepidiprofundi DSM 19306]|uniref:ABC-2 family transporter protein n=1 Tax=Clostridium tepidiprofundi DSM 19306 TaxID=1121338 RepID=A0A151B3Q8_9CLOT|nr:ABC transporter permease [Clostridium tepidiprofundi]KYH34545.1 ABC-2 family transporter protein [Clostridium tepidiprofundi DSM 19306]
MFKKSISAEWLKLRHSRIWLVLIILPIISISLGSINYYFNRGVLQNEWYSLWTQVSLFYGEFFLPILIAICCAFICKLEHVNKNWNIIMTSPISARNIFTSKLVVITILIFMVQVFFLILYFIVGKLFGLSTQIPSETIGWIIRGCFASLTIIALQLGLSIRIKSFAAPIGISLCCIFIGLGMYIIKSGMFFPHSLLSIGMGMLSQEGLSIADNIQFFVMSILFTILFSSLAIHRLKTADVTT